MNLLLPSIAYAATSDKLSDIITKIVGYLSDILFLMMAVAVVVFVWYVIKYFILPNEDRKSAGLYVMYSLIGFFVILSLWGIVNILTNTFGLGNTSNTPAGWSDFRNIFPS
ncbi:MAG: hypothetical protein NT077_02565 [Candidatus Taylorbacteria bacterium]|nr:hypothetical protein [Candidatus Taylorbacteria bacterium]